MFLKGLVGSNKNIISSWLKSNFFDRYFIVSTVWDNFPLYLLGLLSLKSFLFLTLLSIFFESEDKITLLKNLKLKAKFEAKDTKVLPAIIFKFLFLIPVLPPLAGIIA